MKNSIIILVATLGMFIISCNNTTHLKQEKGEKQQFKTERQLPLEWTKNANIYEVNIRQYSKEGTFNAFAKSLPRLKEMGVDILWFMPIHPIGIKNAKGSLGSYYAVRNYKAVSDDYGTIEDFKALVDKAHKLGMHVLIDWVANHTSWDNVWLIEHEDYYEKDSIGNFISPFDWSDVIALDYKNESMREAMADALKFWLTETNIDGFRCDVAGEVPTDFWEWVRPQLNAVKPVFMLAEAEKPELLNKAFDMDYGWEFHHIMNGIAKGEKNAKDVIAYLNREDEKFPQNSLKLYFITNHDENSWNGTVSERLGDAADLCSVMTFTLGGMPLTYSGQESANNKRLKFFEKDVIDWKDYSKHVFLSKLIKIKHENQAVWNGNFGGEYTILANNKDDKFLSFKKSKNGNELYILLNLSKDAYKVNVQTEDLSNYKQLINNGITLTEEMNTFIVAPWSYCIFIK